MPRAPAAWALLPMAVPVLGWPAPIPQDRPAQAQPVRDDAGLDAVRSALAQQGRVSILAELARPQGAELAPAAIAAARAGLAAEMARVGVGEVRGLGSLPYVALEVDARQLEALLASGRVVAVGLNRRAGLHDRP